MPLAWFEFVAAADYVVPCASKGNMPETLEQLNERAKGYYFTSQQTALDDRLRERLIRRCLRDIKGGAVLEFGFVDGQWTDPLLALGCTVVSVEGALNNVEFGRKKYSGNPAVTFVHSTFEAFDTAQKFDWIIMGGMLKHLEDPISFLEKSRGWLGPGGRLIATTPNPKSLHRRVGVKMGLLPDLETLTPTDHQVGNLRHYDLQSFKSLLSAGGYDVTTIATAILKPASSDLMEGWSDKLLDGLDALADELPDYGWAIYAIAKL
jgi:2-polyprenyl-3-methyl-5-hydroxy-6-metoxy-1,4-benzoquinol methylase